MTEEEKKEFAKAIILEHATDVEYMDIFDLADLWHGIDLPESDAKDVVGLIATADITVSIK